MRQKYILVHDCASLGLLDVLLTFSCYQIILGSFKIILLFSLILFQLSRQLNPGHYVKSFLLRLKCKVCTRLEKWQ